jgi:hypothetical protein
MVAKPDAETEELFKQQESGIRPRTLRGRKSGTFEILYSHISKLNKDDRRKNAGYLFKSHKFFENVSSAKQRVMLFFVKQFLALEPAIPSLELLDEFIIVLNEAIEEFNMPEHPERLDLEPESEEYEQALYNFKASQLEVQDALYRIYDIFEAKHKRNVQEEMHQSISSISNNISSRANKLY